MPDPLSRFEPGTLWRMTVERTRSALSHGALQPIATENRTIEDHGVRFEIRVVSSLVRKRVDGHGRWPAATQAATRTNPFLPYERALFIADISDTHLCLLNKYNVIDHHTLIVTRAFEHQEDLLTPADFEALCYCLAEYDALGFYNSGPAAGASQPHKHLQLLPLPLSTATPDIALSVLFDPTAPPDKPIHVARLPFIHSFAWLGAASSPSPTARAAQTHFLYRELLAATGIDPLSPRPRPYNLLVTRRFMLLIPRHLERFATVAVNALGFAGSFFVADRAGLEVIHRTGPMELLRQVGFANAAAD
jgi:sulfate adenylyltransferase (ADP) / ATP adenylyltransferase